MARPEKRRSGSKGKPAQSRRQEQMRQNDRGPDRPSKAHNKPRTGPAPKAGQTPKSGQTARSGQAAKAGQAPEPSTSLSTTRKNGYFLHGRHASEAALNNSNRDCLNLYATEKTMPLAKTLASDRGDLKITSVSPARLDATVGPDSPHQGIVLEVLPIPQMNILDLKPVTGQRNIILMLDQVTDPHNIGACLRSAAAFGARAIITQDRNSPGETGILARAAQGGLETVPWLRVTNLASSIEMLKEMGYWHAGMDGQTDISIRHLSMGDDIVLVMGSEGKGLRPLVAKHCDTLVRIPMAPAMESLNVSNAAAIALYELSGLADG